MIDIRYDQAYPSGALSNLTPHPFELDNAQIASMEGFLQAIKFKNQSMQDQICTLTGFTAKHSGAQQNWQCTQILYWRETEYPRDSTEYQTLLDRAYAALFTTNVTAAKALLASKRATLRHSVGHTNKRETVLTRTEFCSRLTKIRRQLQTDELVTY